MVFNLIPIFNISKNSSKLNGRLLGRQRQNGVSCLPKTQQMLSKLIPICNISRNTSKLNRRLLGKQRQHGIGSLMLSSMPDALSCMLPSRWGFFSPLLELNGTLQYESNLQCTAFGGLSGAIDYGRDQKLAL